MNQAAKGSEPVRTQPGPTNPTDQDGSFADFDSVLCDVVVVLKREWDERVPEALEKLRSVGMDCSTEIVSEEGAVEGIIDTAKLQDLKKLDCVATARCTITYAANHGRSDNSTPPGNQAPPQPIN